MRRWCLALAAAAWLGCEKGPPDLDGKAKPATSAAVSASVVASASALPDDKQPPRFLCARMTMLHNKVKSQISPIDPRICVQKFGSAQALRPDLYPCLSLCIMRADDYSTAAQCSGMCAPTENTCAEVGAKKDACEAKFKAVQKDPSAKNISCVARCGQKFEKIPDVVDCMGAECGL